MDPLQYEPPNLLALCVHKWPAYYDYVKELKILTQEVRCVCGMVTYIPIAYHEDTSTGAYLFEGGSEDDPTKPDVTHEHWVECPECEAQIRIPNLKK